MIKMKARSGFAKSGTYESNELNFTFPGIVNIGSKTAMKSELKLVREDGKLYLNGIILDEKVIKKNRYTEFYEDLVVVPNLSTILKKHRDFVKYILDLRKEIGVKKIIYAPFIGIPPQIPVIMYLGIDLIDTSYTYLASKNGYLFTRYGAFREDGKVEDNLNLMAEYMQETKDAINRNRLRDLVESLPDLTAKSLLRITDLFYYNEIEPFYPVWEKELNAVQYDSLFRADIKRFIERVIERYHKPALYNTLLLLPCSAKKPYSDSKSHRFFRNLIADTGKMVHEVIVTSPPAVVPRELETVYPAQNYDISVIGYWYQDEIKLIRGQLKRYIENNRYENIIAYLPEDLEFLRDLLESYGAKIIIGNLRAAENIKALKDLILSSNSPSISRMYQIKEEIKAVIRYQFGDSFDNILEKLTITGRYPNIEILLDNDHFMHFNRDKGMVSLSLNAAKILAEKHRYSVTIENFEPKGTVFAVGVLDATEDIRKEDEVAIIIDGKAVGAGTAKMNYADLRSQDYGEAIKIRAFKK
ncbi:MAG: DUF5591 domain-containing protein [Thermoplasmata archaeon]